VLWNGSEGIALAIAVVISSSIGLPFEITTRKHDKSE
jgi:hypothetical protein